VSGTRSRSDECGGMRAHGRHVKAHAECAQCMVSDGRERDGEMLTSIDSVQQQMFGREFGPCGRWVITR
jgi:hypothetical protein